MQTGNCIGLFITSIWFLFSSFRNHVLLIHLLFIWNPCFMSLFFSFFYPDSHESAKYCLQDKYYRWYKIIILSILVTLSISYHQRIMQAAHIWHFLSKFLSDFNKYRNGQENTNFMFFKNECDLKKTNSSQYIKRYK